MKFLRNLPKEKIFGKTCLLRVDLNIAEKEAKNSPRILGILPTIKFLIKNGAKVILLGHRGRPNGFDKKQSLKPFVKILSNLLNKKIYFIDFDKNLNFTNGKDKDRKKNVATASSSIFLLENLRFLRGELKNDLKLAKQLSSFGDFYVNDAFSGSHRANVSVSAITKFLPSYAGFLMEKEIKNLSIIMKNPKKPLTIILGGAKISSKLGLINNFMSKADYFLIGGGIANTFFAAQNLPIGDSINEKSMEKEAGKLFKNNLPIGQAGLSAGRAGNIILPIDVVISKRKILDIGQNTINLYSQIIKKSKTIIWNGPMGYFEDKKFAKGSQGIARAILKSRAFAVVGGGETASLFKLQTADYKLRTNIFISTGGGAMLEYLAGKKLPGIEVLK